MSESKSGSSGWTGPGLPTLIFLIFLVLKLTGIGVVADWSWWWVTSPLWIGAGFWVAVIALYVIVLIAHELAR